MPAEEAQRVVWQGITDHTLAQLDMPDGATLDRIAQRHGFPSGEQMRTIITNSVTLDRVLTPAMLRALGDCEPSALWLE